MTLRAVEYVPESFAIHRALLRAALALGNAFAWIFIVKLVGGSLALAAALYALEAFTVLLLTPLSARLVRVGLFASVTSGVALFSLGCAALALALGNPASLFGTLGPIVFALCVGGYRALYWVPYRAYAASVALPLPLSVTANVFVALMPFFGGVIAAVSGVAWVHWAAAAFAALSLLSLAGSAEAHERFLWGYRETFRILFSRAHIRTCAAGIAEGVEAGALFFLWPLTIYLLVGGNVFVVGAVFSATLLVTLIIRLVLTYLREERGVRVPHYMLVAIGISGWLMRLGVVTPVQVIAVDAFQHIGSRGRVPSIDTEVFGQAADGGSFIDEHSALKEMALAVGRFVLAAFLCALAFVWQTPYVLAAGIFAAAILFALHPLIARRT